MVNKQLMVAIDFHGMGNILWKTMGTLNCLVTHIFFFFFFYRVFNTRKKKVRVSKWQNFHVFGWTIPLSSTTLIVPVIRNVSWASNQHIRMISEGSCDTEDWNTGCWKWTFAITGIIIIKKNGNVCNTAKKSTLDILQNFSFCVPQKGFKWHFIFVWTIPFLKFKKCN